MKTSQLESEEVKTYRLSASNLPNGDKGYFKGFKPFEISNLEELGNLMLTHSLCTQLFSSDKIPNKEGKFPVAYRKTTEAVIDTGDVIFFDVDNASVKDSKIQCDNPITLKKIVKAFKKQAWGCVVTPSKNSTKAWEKFHIAAFTSSPVPSYKTNKQSYRNKYAAVASILDLELNSAMMSAIQNLTPALNRKILQIVEGNPVDISVTYNKDVSGFSKNIVNINNNSRSKINKYTDTRFTTVILKKKKFKSIKGLKKGTRCDCPKGKKHSDGQGKGYGFVNSMKGITCNGCNINYHWLKNNVSISKDNDLSVKKLNDEIKSLSRSPSDIKKNLMS